MTNAHDAFTHPLTEWRERQEPKRTLLSLANEIGVVPSHLSQIENWLRTPSLDLAGKLSTATGIPINKFIRSNADEQERCQCT